MAILEGQNVKLFKLTKPGDNAPILDRMTLDNAYITAYPAVQPGHKHPRDLEVGEHSEAVYSLGGSKGTYWIVRYS